MYHYHIIHSNGLELAYICDILLARGHTPFVRMLPWRDPRPIAEDENAAGRLPTDVVG